MSVAGTESLGECSVVTSAFGSHPSHPVPFPNPPHRIESDEGLTEVKGCLSVGLFASPCGLMSDVGHHVISLLVTRIFSGVCSSPWLALNWVVCLLISLCEFFIDSECESLVIYVLQICYLSL